MMLPPRDHLYREPDEQLNNAWRDLQREFEQVARAAALRELERGTGAWRGGSQRWPDDCPPTADVPWLPRPSGPVEVATSAPPRGVWGSRLARLLLWLVGVGLVLWLTASAAQAQTPRGTIKVAWDALPATDQVTAYRLYWGTASGTYTDQIQTAGDVTTGTAILLEACTDYYLAVSAENVIGEGMKSIELVGWPRPVVDAIACTDSAGVAVGSTVEVGRTYTCTVTGESYKPGANVTIIGNGVGETTVTMTAQPSCRELQMQMAIAADAVPGAYNVRARNLPPDGPFGGNTGLLKIVTGVDDPTPGPVLNLRRDDR